MLTARIQFRCIYGNKNIQYSTWFAMYLHEEKNVREYDNRNIKIA